MHRARLASRVSSSLRARARLGLSSHPRPIAYLGALRAADERLADVTHGEHARGLDIVPILLRERIDTAREGKTTRNHPSSVTPPRNPTRARSRASHSSFSSSTSLDRAIIETTQNTQIFHPHLAHRATTTTTTSRRHRAFVVIARARVDQSPTTTDPSRRSPSHRDAKTRDARERAKNTHAFFLPPFLPLDIRLFLPTAMTTDSRARVKGGRRRSRTRVGPGRASGSRVVSLCITLICV